MVDLFAALRALPSVAKVANLYQSDDQPLDLFFFLCPKTDGHGFRLNRHRTGFCCHFLPEIAPSYLPRLESIRRLEEELSEAGISFRTRAVFAAADSLLLFPFHAPPPTAPEIGGLEIISNAEIVRKHLDDFVLLYHKRPWQQLKPRVLGQEHQRISSLLHGDRPANLEADLVERCFAGFALDGLLARQGYFGPNPVLIAIEGPNVALLQNCALPKESWLPIIHLL